MEPDAPKLEIKSLIVPAIVFFHKKFINFDDPDIVEKARLALYTVIALALALYFLLWDLVRRKKDEKTIWVPPAAPQALPFMPKPEPPKPEDFEKTTYEAHELKLVRGSVQSLLLSCGIAIFVSYKFNIHISILMQAIMIPMTLWDSPVFRKHILRKTSDKTFYNETFVVPTAGRNDVNEDENIPRVEQLPDDDDSQNSKSKSKSANGTKKQNINSID